MTASEAKHWIQRYTLWERGFTLCVTEGLNSSDVLAVRDGLAIEYEIKVSKSDLMREIKVIQTALRKQTFGYSRAKLEKHETYLGNRQPRIFNHYTQEAIFIPNFFTFVVPDALAECAAQGVLGTPYGVLTVSDRGNITNHVTARRIKDEPVEVRKLYRVMHRACLENYTLRKELASARLESKSLREELKRHEKADVTSEGGL